jgi:hypothetical protein
METTRALTIREREKHIIMYITAWTQNHVSKLHESIILIVLHKYLPADILNNSISYLNFINFNLPFPPLQAHI